MNIEEAYVSFETAKLLKEKGFDVKCDKCYAYFAGDDVRCLNLKYPKSAQLLIENRYPCVTLQMAMKWLREVYNIKVNVFYSNPNYAIEYFETNTQTGVDESVFIGDDYKSYEEAVEAAIKYCLENLV